MTITIPSTLSALANDLDTSARAMRDLIQQKLTVQAYYGFRSLGSTDPLIAFPCVFVEPIGEKWEMVRLGKFRLTGQVELYWYCQESNQESIVSECLNIGSRLKKLFSNNALDDVGGANTNQYFQYPGYWLSCVMSSITYSTNFLNATSDNQNVLMRGGMARLEVYITDFVP